jgi:hypothetical protein
MIYDATLNGIGEIYSNGQRAAYGIFDNGYFFTVEGTQLIGLRHCDNPGTIISTNACVAMTSGGGSRFGWANGQVYAVTNMGSTTANNLYKMTTNGSTITTTLVKSNIGTTLNTGAWGMLCVSPSGNVIATKSYYSSDTNVNSIFWGESFGFDSTTGNQLWHFIWKNMGHTGARMCGIVSDTRILVDCQAHVADGRNNRVHLMDTTTGAVLDDWPGTIPGSYDEPQTWLNIHRGYSAVIGENLIMLSDDVTTATNPKIIVLGAVSTAGDQFTINWLRYFQTDWMRTYYGNEGYPIAFNWMNDRRVCIVTGGYSYSGGHFEQSVYIVDSVTGDVSVGESTPWITDGVSFYTGGQFMSGLCGPDDLYISIISNGNLDTYHHSYTIHDGGTADKTDLYYRRVLTDGDTLAWADAEYQVTTNWPRGWNLLARTGQFNNRITIAPEQPCAHENDASPVYWIDPVVNGYAASETKTNAWLTAKGTTTDSVAAGDLASVVHMMNKDNEEETWEKVWGLGTLILWGSGILSGFKPIRMRQRDDKYGQGASSRLSRFSLFGASKQAGQRIGPNNTYQ